jgi:tRNA-dihydrouridine synthase
MLPIPTSNLTTTLAVGNSTVRDKMVVAIVALDKLEEGAAMDRPEWRNIRAIDLNFGCPSPSISKRGAGPAQLRRRSKVQTIFGTLGDWRKTTSLPMIGAVGAKIRLGANAREQEYKVYLPVAQAVIGCLDYLVVHTRHAKERSRDPPAWEAIAEIKQSIEPSCSLPIIGNGNIRTAADMARITELTGCDGVMVGLEAMRNPWALRGLVNGKEDDDYSDKQLCRQWSNWNLQLPNIQLGPHVGPLLVATCSSTKKILSG